MLPTRIFRESPFKALKIFGAILGSILLFFTIVIFSDELPQITTAGLNKSAEALVILGGIFLGFSLLVFVVLSFQSRKILKCDYEGCEILDANFWNTTGFFNQFKWSEVKDTNIIEKDVEVSDGVVTIYTFAAENKDGHINLLDLKTSSKKNIEGLIYYVNKATPHLQHIWVKDADVGSRLAVDSVYGYSKVGRN